MSVLVVNRKESRFEAISFAVDLHDMLIELMQRSFGLRAVEQFVRKRFARGAMTEDKIIYYRQLIHEAKKRIDEYASMLTSNVRAANTIYPTNMDEYYTRRGYQNAAIINCEQIIKELQHIVDVFEVDINMYDRYIQAIDREIGLIKHWRQRDNQIKSRLPGSA